MACNYNEAATDSDDSCVFADDACEVCDGDAVVLNDADGDGVCDADEVAGCQDEMACNYTLRPPTLTTLVFSLTTLARFAMATLWC